MPPLRLDSASLSANWGPHADQVAVNFLVGLFSTTYVDLIWPSHDSLSISMIQASPRDRPKYDGLWPTSPLLVYWKTMFPKRFRVGWHQSQLGSGTSVSNKGQKKSNIAIERAEFSASIAPIWYRWDH